MSCQNTSRRNTVKLHDSESFNQTFHHDSQNPEVPSRERSLPSSSGDGLSPRRSSRFSLLWRSGVVWVRRVKRFTSGCLTGHCGVREGPAWLGSQLVVSSLEYFRKQGSESWNLRLDRCVGSQDVCGEGCTGRVSGLL